MPTDDTLQAVNDFYAIDEEIKDNFRRLHKYAPGAVDAYMALRTNNYRTPPEGALTARETELVIIGMECAIRKSNPTPVFHTESAIRAGATLADISEVLSLAIMIAGMITYQESGQYVLKEAERLVEAGVGPDSDS